MRIFLFLISLILMTVVVPLLAGRLLRITNKTIWKYTILDYGSRYLIFSILFFVLIWIAGSQAGVRELLLLGVTGTSFVLMISFILLATLPVSLAYRKLLAWIGSIRRDMPLNPSRRRVLKTGAAFLPLLAIGSTGTGVARSFQDVRFPKVELFFKDLPESLNDMRILHLSDLHLGYYLQLNDLEQILKRVEKEKFDLVLITGDVADELSQLTEALNLIDDLRPSIPKFMSLGNHEYHRGIRQVYSSVEKSRIPLLKNNGQSIKYKNDTLYIAGADDPVTMRKDIHAFLDHSVQSAMNNAPENSFNILLSHRPRALDIAGKHGVNLVLSGHTHGGQLGMNGRSLFEPLAQENYLWGPYKNSQTQLYTSSGVGHWFPFRLGCPAEAPVIIIRKET